MTKVSSTAFAKIYIGAATFPSQSGVTLQVSDYTTETWTEIGGVTNIGDFGDSAEEVKVNIVNDARVLKLKGQRDAGDLTLECAFDDADAGQLAVMVANQDAFNRGFRIVFNNPPSPTTGKGTTVYFRGLVMSAQTKSGTANNPVMLVTKIGINTAPLSVAASAT